MEKTTQLYEGKAKKVFAVNREVTDSDGKTYKLIQTDAAINS